MPVIDKSGGNIILSADSDGYTILVDKDKPSAGSDLVVNGVFNADTGWTKSGNWAIGSGVASDTAGSVGTIEQDVSASSGTVYVVTFDITQSVTDPSDYISVTVGSATAQTFRSGSSSASMSAIFSATGTGNLSFTSTSGWAGTLDNVVCKSLTVNGSGIIFRGPTSGTGATVGGLENFNFFLGNTSGQYSASAIHNISLGTGASELIYDGDYNVVLGFDAGERLGVGSQNVMIGYNSGESLIGGGSNVLLGSFSGRYLYDSDNVVGIGTEALENAYSAGATVAVGYRALTDAAFSEYNTAVGYQAGLANTTGSTNAFYGALSGSQVTTGSYNSFYGASSGFSIVGSDYNTAFGYQALSGGGSPGDDNIAIGYLALGTGTKSGSCSKNVVIGSYALEDATDANDTVAIGYGSLMQATSGTDNTCIGTLSGTTITTGDDNVAVGNRSLQNLGTGINNVAVGSTALQTASDNGTGTCEYNTAVGYGALQDLDSHTDVSVNNNIGVGYGAGTISGTGYLLNGNVFIGAGSQHAGSGALNSATVVGAGATTASGITSNGVVVGNSASVGGNGAITVGSSSYASGTETIVIGYNNAGASNNTVYLGNSSTTTYNMYAASWTNISDKRLKDNIEDSDLGIDFIMSIRPVKYTFRNTEEVPEKFKRPHYGFIAQEIKETIDCIGIDFGGYVDPSIKTPGSKDHLGLGYTEFIAPAIKAIQEQQKIITDLKDQLDILKNEVYKLKKVKN